MDLRPSLFHICIDSLLPRAQTFHGTYSAKCLCPGGSLEELYSSVSVWLALLSTLLRFSPDIETTANNKSTSFGQSNLCSSRSLISQIELQTESCHPISSSGTKPLSFYPINLLLTAISPNIRHFEERGSHSPNLQWKLFVKYLNGNFG